MYLRARAAAHMADLTTAMSLPAGTHLSFGLAPGGLSSRVWVSPACTVNVSWGPKSDPTMRGRLEDGFVTVIATFSRTSVTVPVCNGVAMIVPMQWVVEDTGRIESALTFKIGMRGCAPNRLGTSNAMSEQVHALAAPIVTYGNGSWTVAEISRNGVLSQHVDSLENPDVTFTVQVETRYLPTPQQTQLVQELGAGHRETLAGIQTELAVLSKRRADAILDFVSKRAGDLEACQQWFVRCPENSFSQMGYMDTTQMQALGDAMSDVHRAAYMMYLVPAAQRCLVRVCGPQGGATGFASAAAVHAALATPAQRAALRDCMLDEVAVELTCNSTYTYDAGIGGFTAKVQNKRMLDDRERVISGFMTRSGESQNLAGLMDVGSLRLREACCERARATLAALRGHVPGNSVTHTINQTAVESCNKRFDGDCEDGAFAISNTMRSLMKHGKGELAAAAQQTLEVMLPHEPQSHDAIVAVLDECSVAMAEAEARGEVMGTSLVFAGGAEARPVTATAVDETPQDVRATARYAQMKTDVKKLGGHCVATLTQHCVVGVADGVEVSEIDAKWRVYESTANIVQNEGAANESVVVQLEDTGHLTGDSFDTYNGQEFNRCTAENIQASFNAAVSHARCLRNPATSLMALASLRPQGSNDPSAPTSFYHYAMAMNGHMVFTGDAGAEGVLRGVGASRPCCSLPLSKSRCDEDAAKIVALRVPLSVREATLINLAAVACRGLYPTNHEIHKSMRRTHLQLMPTETVLPMSGLQNVVICQQPAAELGQGMPIELAARKQMVLASGAKSVRNLNSHVFGIGFA